MTANLYNILAAGFPSDRSKPALETPETNGQGGKVYSYGELETSVAKLAGRLRDAGLKPGDRLAVQVGKSPQALFLYLATIKAGGVFLPLNAAYTPAEVAYFLEDAEPHIFVCDPKRQESLQAAASNAGVTALFTLDSAGEGSLIAGLEQVSPLDATVEREPEDLAALLYTSGTTGRSKGAMLTHRNLSSNALSLHRIWGFQPDEVLLHALPIYHTHGLFVASNCSLLNGSSMLFLPKFDARQVITLLPRAQVMMGVPTFYSRLLAEPEFNSDLTQGLRLFISGSAPLLSETWHAFEEATGHAILERYGMTEIGMGTSNPLEGLRKPGTVGLPLPDVAVKVCDEEGKQLPDGEIGVLEITGPNVFSGYWRRPEKTAEEFREDGYFITGDLARIDEDGYVQIVGRSKDLIISGGFNVYPKEIEQIIDDHEAVAESAVIGLPHPDFGEAVSAAVVMKDAGASLDEQQLISHCRQSLAAFKSPKRIFFVDALPRNSMGKVQKNLLRDTYADAFQSQ